MNTTAPARPRIVVELDGEALAALDRACRHERLRRPIYARSVLLRALREAGHLTSTTSEASR